nr:hypothetical protein [Tanacetum cinerariifolium]
AFGPRYEIGESSSAAAARQAGGFRADYSFVTAVDREIMHDPEREVGYGITDSWDDIVQNDDHYDVFAIDCQHTVQSESVHNTYLIEQDAQNVLIESEDMNYDCKTHMKNTVNLKFLQVLNHDK